MPSRKVCFGLDDYFSENSRGCIRCRDYDECQEEVSRKARRAAINWGSTTSSTVKRHLPGVTTRSTSSKAPAVMRDIGVSDSLYNFEEAILPQLVKYAGFSIAEVTLEELHTLVRQARTDYIDRLHSVVETIEVPETTKTKTKT